MHAEDHQGGDDAPAAVTCVFAGLDFGRTYCEGTCKTALEHNFQVVKGASELMFGSRTTAEPVEGVIVCDAKLDYCACALAAGHEGPHVCGRDDGSWTYDDDGDLRIVAFPDVLKALGYKQ